MYVYNTAGRRTHGTYSYYDPTLVMPIDRIQMYTIIYY